MPLAVAYAAVALVLVWLGLRWFERVNLYSPSREMAFHPGTLGLPYEDLWLAASDGGKVNAWFVPAKTGAAPGGPTLLLCHGNGGNMSHRLDKLKIFHGLGLSVMLFDYRGYGKSPGVPSERGTYRDAEAAWRHLALERRVPPRSILLYGESLGAAVAVELAKRYAATPPAALIIDSGFTSTLDMGREVFPGLPVSLLVRYRYDNLAKIGAARSPVLVMHSPHDDIVPYEMGRRLYEAAPPPKEFFEMRGDHNEGFLMTGDAYGRAIAGFLERHASRPPRTAAGGPRAAAGGPRAAASGVPRP